VACGILRQSHSFSPHLLLVLMVLIQCMRTVLVGKPASLPSSTISKECREGLTMLLPPRRRLMLVFALLA
jgi:hypothetical protein